MDVVADTAGLRDALGIDPCVLVPTMGALHEGHLSLIDLAREIAADDDLPVCVSIFVNPAQFNDPADLDAYPRPLDADLAALLARHVDIVFTPSAETVYPPSEPEAAPQPDLPAVATEPGLEDRYRPGHFAGVCRVLNRLFDLCDPEAAVFGEKDWQQFRVVTEMCRMQGREISIVPAPTARESDGLAMSSRNTLLPMEARPHATALRRGISEAQARSDSAAAERVLRETIEGEGLTIDYATIRDAESMTRGPSTDGVGPWRIFVAARLAGVRLLDNAPWPA